MQVAAAVENDVKAVKKWSSEPRHRHPKQLSKVLVEAASRGHDNICQLMLDSGEVPDDDIATALSIACHYNQLSTAQLLARHGHFSTEDLTETLTINIR